MQHKDPVCGMMVEESTAKWKWDYQGTTYYFCAKGCQVAFQKDPEKFLKNGPMMHMPDHGHDH